MTKPEYDKVGIKKALGDLVSAWQPAIASEAVVQARREAEAKVWAEVDAVFQLGAATTASPVQGAASASGAKGDDLMRLFDSYGDACYRRQSSKYEIREQFIAALAERAQAAQPSGAVAGEFSSSGINVLQGARIIAMVNDAKFRSREAAEEMAARIAASLTATPATEQEAAQEGGDA